MAPYMLPTYLQDVGYGIQLSSQGRIESKTFACYLDAMGILRYGYIYPNGSNYRVASWEDEFEQRKNRTVPRSGRMILFPEIVTPHPFSSPNFNPSNFAFSWFDPKVKQNLRNALMAWKKVEFDNLTDQMAGLFI